MSLALKKNNNEINFLRYIIYHVSLFIFLTLLVLHNLAIAIKIIIYFISDFISILTKKFIMMATERSAGIAKSCLVLVEFLAMNYIKYIDFVLDEEQKQKISSEQNSIKTILANASKRVQTPTKKDVIPAPNTPVVSAEILKKSEAVRQTSTKKSSSNKASEITPSPAHSMLAELSSRKAEKSQLPLEQRYRTSVPSSLDDNHSIYSKSMDFYPSKRYTTSASEKPKRTTTMKLINSTAANRALKNKKRRQYDDDDDDVEEIKSSKQNHIKSQSLSEKNLNLFDERPLLSQPPRTLHLNQSPEINLQAARRYLKVMIKVRKHRNTI
uniref:Putative helicase C550.03c n=1 Tax=Anthurium amnicola TaxID=1678845 RepID=A0A1D1YMM4_9ARAE